MGDVRRGVRVVNGHVDDALDARGHRSVHGHQPFVRLRRADRVEKKHAVVPGERGLQGCGIEQIADPGLDPLELLRLLGLPGQHAHLLAPREQLPNDLGAHGSRAADHQVLHDRTSCMPFDSSCDR